MLAPYHGRTRKRCRIVRRMTTAVPLCGGGNVLSLDVGDDETPEVLAARVEQFMNLLIV